MFFNRHTHTYIHIYTFDKKKYGLAEGTSYHPYLKKKKIISNDKSSVLFFLFVLWLFFVFYTR